jgi:transcriptional regulator of acetoin/glycerol metabolism
MADEKNQEIVDDFLRITKENCPEFTEEISTRVEHQIRQIYGGTEDNYVRKTSTATMRKNQQAVEEARRTGRVREAAARHGVSLRTVYRSLKKKT